MYHSITFGDKNTWDDWFLIPETRPVFAPPEAKTLYEEIPGADGSLDYSEALTGDIHYGNRTGSLNFIVDNYHRQWFELYSEISDYLHGQKLKAVLEDDLYYFYIGRFAVNEWRSESQNSKIVIDYTLEPYKLERTSSMEDWLWDPFNFESGIIREYKNLTVDKKLTFTIQGRRKTVIPIFTVKSSDGNGMKVTYNGKAYNLPDGTSRIVNIALKDGLSTLVFSGNGFVSIDYRGGRL